MRRKPKFRHLDAVSRRDGLGLGLAALALATMPGMAMADDGLIARAIPHSGEKVPVVGLGTAVGFDIDDGDAKARDDLAGVIGALVKGGGSVIDTASSYGNAESVVSSIVAPMRPRPSLFLATKLESRDAHAGRKEVEQSLKLLRVAKLDLLQLHNIRRPNESLAALRDWKAQGLCRYIGITTSSNRDFQAIEAVLRREKPDFLEVNYSINDREAEERLLPAAAEAGAAVLIDLPFGRGNLFDKVRGKMLPAWASDFDAASWGQFFLKYLVSHEAVTAVIPGTTKASHMIDNLGAGRGRLPNAEERRKMVAFWQSLG